MPSNISVKNIVLIIEDIIDEQQKAKDAVVRLGKVPIIAGNLEDGRRLFNQLQENLFGVITDLHYPSMNTNNQDAEKPNGLAMVAMCVNVGIRVGVCSDVNHHFSEYLKIPIKTFSSHQSYPFGSIPFSEDTKDWNRIMNQLINL